MKQVLITICAIICIVVAILLSGVVVCMSSPQITENLSRATALVDTAHFSRDQLVDVANKAREFVANEVQKIELYEVVKKINVDAKTEYAEYEPIDFAAVPDEYSLDSKAISHLEDVQSLFANIRIAFGICLFGSILFCALLLVIWGRGAFGRVLFWSGLIIIAGLVVLIGWSIFDFNDMFNSMHSLFFSNGSWLFDAKSLIIAVYPTSFWVAMSAICVVISTIFSILLIIIGKIIR